MCGKEHQWESVTDGSTHVDFHVFVHPIVHDQGMCKPDSMRFHRMSSGISIVANIRVVKVCNTFLVRGSHHEGVNWGTDVRHIGHSRQSMRNTGCET